MSFKHADMKYIRLLDDLCCLLCCHVVQPDPDETVIDDRLGSEGFPINP